MTCKILCFVSKYWEWILASISLIVTIIQAFKIEKYKNKLELQKSKDILNDWKLRNAYENFVSLIFEIYHNNWKNKSIEDWIDDFVKNMLLFSWPNTIKAINNYKTNKSSIESEKLLLIENIIMAMRKDLWASNKWLNDFDIIQLLINWNIKNYFKSNQKK